MPTKQDKLEVAIVEEFCPRFAPRAKLIYRAETIQKSLVLEKTALTRLGVRVSDHDGFPDVILYNANKKWLFLIEAATTGGYISPKRRLELEALFKKCMAGKIYITAFRDFATYIKYSNDIAWETEVWIAEMPSHLIHYNGDKFLGPK